MQAHNFETKADFPLWISILQIQREQAEEMICASIPAPGYSLHQLWVEDPNPILKRSTKGKNSVSVTQT